MSARPPRCHSCGKRAGVVDGSCRRCGVPQEGLCECGATVSLYATTCGRCGVELTPKRYRRRWTHLRVLVVLTVFAGITLGIYLFLPRDPLDERNRLLGQVRGDIEARRYESARLKCERYIEQYGEDLVVLPALGVALKGLGRSDQAREVLLRALEQDPEMDRVLIPLAQIAYEEERFEAALDFAERAAERSRPRYQASLLAGEIRARHPELRDVERAVHHLRRAIRGLQEAGRGTAAFEYRRLLAECCLAWLARSPEAALEAEVLEDLQSARREAASELEGLEGDERSALLSFLARCDLALGRPRDAYASLLTIGRSGAMTTPHRILLGRVLWEMGDREKALLIFRQISESPQPADILLEVARFAERAGRPDLSAKVIRRAAEQHPGVPEVVAANVRRLTAEGDPEAAEAEAKRLLAEHPTHPSLLQSHADAIYLQAGRQEEAEDLLRRGAEIGGPSSPLWLRMAEILLQTPPGDPRANERIEKVASWLLSESPRGGDSEADRIRRRVLSGRLHLRRGHFLSAIEVLTPATARLKNDPVPHLLLAAAYRGRRKPGLEAMEISAAIGLTGPRPDLLRMRADAYLRAGLTDRATKDAERVLDEDPEDPAALLLLARTLLGGDAEELAKAEAVLRKAAKGPGAEPRVRPELAAVIHRLGRVEAAKVEIQRAMDEAVDDPARLRLADRLSEIRAPDGAQPFLPQAEEILAGLAAGNPGEGAILLRLALVRFRQGLTASAEEAIRLTLEANPRSLGARRMLFEMLLDSGPPSGSELERASALAAEAASIGPESFSALYMRGRLVLERESPEEAVEILLRADKAQPDHPAASFFLAAALFKSGKFSEAREILVTLSKDFPRSLQARRLLAAANTEVARERLRSGKALEASDLLDAALESQPDLVPARLLLAQACFEGGGELGPISRAREDLEALIRDLKAGEDPDRDTSLAQAYLLLGNICFNRRDEKGLLAACRAYTELRPRDPVGRLRLGLAHLVAADPDSAASELALAAGIEPENFGIQRTWFAVLEAADRREKALDLVEAWIEAHREDATAESVRGGLHFRAGRTSEAEAAFRRSLALDPDQLASITGLYHILETEGRLEEAVEWLRSHVEATTFKGDVRLLLARALEREDPGSAEAEALLKRAAREEIESPLLWADCCLALIRIHGANGAYMKAASLGEEFDIHRRRYPVLTATPASTRLTARILFRAGLAWGLLGEKGRAERLYRSALEVLPEHVPSLNNLAILLGEDVLTLEKAVSLAVRAGAASDTPEVWDTLSVLYLKRGDALPALTAAEKAMRLLLRRRKAGGASLEGGDPEAQLSRYHLHLAQARFGAGRTDAARESLEEAERVHPPIRQEEEFRRLALRLR